MTCRAWKQAWVSCGVLALCVAACSDDDTDAAQAADMGSEAHAGHGGAAGADAHAQGGAGAAGKAAMRDAPTEYPADWQVKFTDARPLPADYDFGHKTETLKAGTTYGTQKLALPCDVAWERDVEVALRDGTKIYLDLLGPTEPKSKLPALVAWSPYGKTFPGMPPASVPPEPIEQMKPSSLPSVCSRISGAVVSIWAWRLATLSNWLAQTAPPGSVFASSAASRPETFT